MPAVLVPITGSVLEWAMQEAGLTDRDVGVHLGIDPGRVRAWITGAEQPSKTLFDRLSRLLDRPESFFFLATPPPTVTTTARFRAPAGGRGHQPPSLEDLGSVSVGDLPESVVADEDGGEVGEGLEMLGSAFVAAGQAAVVHQPGQG